MAKMAILSRISLPSLAPLNPIHVPSAKRTSDELSVVSGPHRDHCQRGCPQRVWTSVNAEALLLRGGRSLNRSTAPKVISTTAGAVEGRSVVRRIPSGLARTGACSQTFITKWTSGMHRWSSATILRG
jgi:hypothetical protein